MAKTDIPPLPLHPPKKRRHMENALDIHLAMWASNETLTPSEKRRVQEERERRKRMRPRTERIGVLIGSEGITPEQYVVLAEKLTSYKGVMSQIWHPWASGAVHSLCKSYGVDVEVHRDADVRHALATIIRNSTKVLAFPSGTRGDVWESVSYAKHRSVPVDVFMPNGERR